MASALQKYLRSEYSHSVHGGVSSLLAVVSSPAHQHAPQECTAVPGPSLGTIPHTTGPSSTVHCRPPWQCRAMELWQALTLYQAFLRRGLPGSYACGPCALPGLPSQGGGGLVETCRTIVPLLTKAAAAPRRPSHAGTLHMKSFPRHLCFGGCPPPHLTWEMYHRTRGFHITTCYTSIVPCGSRQCDFLRGSKGGLALWSMVMWSWSCVWKWNGTLATGSLVRRREILDKS